MDAVLEEEFEINHISYIPSPRLAQSASELVTGPSRNHMWKNEDSVVDLLVQVLSDTTTRWGNVW
jgi:hypothetical protein